MNFTELLMGSVTAEQTAASFRTETRQNGSGSNSGGFSFANVLGARMNSPSVRTENHRNPLTEDIARQSAANGSGKNSAPLYESYRQTRQSLQKTGFRGEPDASGKVSYEEEVIQDDSDTDLKSEETAKISNINVIQILAQLLGVDREKLNKLLAESGISPEDLNSLENTNETAAILSETLGLNSDQEETLEKLLEMIKGTATSTSLSGSITEGLSYDPDEQLTQEASEKASVISGKPEAQKTVSDPAIEQLLSHISEKLDDFAEMLVSEQDTAEDEIKNLLAALLNRSEAAKKNVIQGDQPAIAGTDSTEGIPVSETNNAQESELQEEDAPEDKEKDDFYMKDAGREQELLQKPTQHDGENLQHVFTAIGSDNAGTADVSNVSTERQTVPAREIISQIVEKAGAVITQDKSEMVMELKPDSLGRISLKVVTENGIVMAKFIAENRQVQQVLETNMQILRDAMERQGINVQSLSVSVRQDGGQRGENRQQYGNPQRIGSRRSITRAGAGEGAITAFVEEAAGRNPYLWESSTINLTA